MGSTRGGGREGDTLMMIRTISTTLESHLATHRTVRTTRVVMFLVNWRVQRRRKVHRGQVRQRPRVVPDRYLHRIVVCTWMDAERENKNIRFQSKHPQTKASTHLIPGSLPQDDLGRLLSMIPMPPLLLVPSPPTIKLTC